VANLIEFPVFDLNSGIKEFVKEKLSSMP